MSNQDETYEDKFAALWAEISKNPQAKEEFEKNPSGALAEAGIPVMQSVMLPQMVKDHPVSLATSPSPIAGSGEMLSVNANETEKVSVKTHWWGVDIKMNEKLTQDIVSGITGAGPLGSAIATALSAGGLITGGVATAIGAAIAAICAAKIAEIKIFDKGKGVHWPITWIQWGQLLSAVPIGPAGIIATAMAFIHPLRN